MKKQILLLVLITAITSLACSAQQITAIKNVNVIPMTSDKLIKQQTVLIKGNKIIQIGSVNDVSIPKDAIIIVGTDKYLMPGLADMHVHLTETFYSVPMLNLFLANGVTTVRDENGSAGDYLIKWKRDVESGKRPGPAIIAGSPILHSITSDPEKEIQEYMDYGFDFLKIYSDMPRKQFELVMKTANKLNIYTIGHLPYSVKLNDAIDQGYDEIVHMNNLIQETLDYNLNRNSELNKFQTEEEWSQYIFINLFMKFKKDYSRKMMVDDYQAKVKKVIAGLIKRKIPISTTLNSDLLTSKRIRYKNFILDKNVKYLNKSSLNNMKRLSDRLSEKMKKNYELGGLFYSVLDSLFVNELKNKGIPIVLGSDVFAGSGSVPGFSIYEELDILVGYGFSPYEAIKTGTVNANMVAKKMGFKMEFGTIEIGKKADLILLKSNPLNEIGNLKDRVGVMAAGVWYSSKNLNDMIRIKKKYIPKPGMDVLFKIFKRKGFESMITEYKKSKNAINIKDRRININENQLNGLGYKFLRENLITEALKVFELNVKTHPFSANCYDSWAEAYLKSGNKAKAIEYYKKALQIYPNLESSKKALKKINQ
jgi:tetratricopeptide (TPR) repeat protein